MSKINWPLTAAVTIMAALLFFLYSAKIAFPRDLGQWPDNEVSGWYRSLMQPDNPTVSCCGEADAYWCDSVNVKAGKTFCTITDDRDDAPLGRQHVAIGTQIEIPDYKLKWDKGNPTGHAIVFLSYMSQVFCFVQNGGV